MSEQDNQIERDKASKFGEKIAAGMSMRAAMLEAGYSKAFAAMGRKKVNRLMVQACVERGVPESEIGIFSKLSKPAPEPKLPKLVIPKGEVLTIMPPELKRPPVQNSEGTRWQKGVSGNPGGKPKAITQALREIAAMVDPSDEKTYAQKLGERLAEIALDAKPNESIAAISEFTDRTEGKAVQSIRAAGVFMVMPPGEDALNAAFGALSPEEEFDALEAGS